MFPGGNTPNASLSLPELPPSSVTVTIAVTNSRAAASEIVSPLHSPSMTAGNPVPPPMATRRGARCEKCPE
jgi:hypothetical protein